jgi:hypothetical protein
MTAVYSSNAQLCAGVTSGDRNEPLNFFWAYITCAKEVSRSKIQKMTIFKNRKIEICKNRKIEISEISEIEKVGKKFSQIEKLCERTASLFEPTATIRNPKFGNRKSNFSLVRRPGGNKADNASEIWMMGNQ